MAIPTDVEGTWFNTTVSLDAGELRRADAAMFAGDGSVTTGVRGGIVRHADTSLAVTVDGSDVVTVQPGTVVVPGDAVAGTGPYRLSLAAAITGALAARNATNPRITLVIFRAYDDDVVGSHNAYKGTIEFVNGTAAASPTAPALPSMAVELARITVPNTGGGAATVDSTFRTYATAIGGELVVSTLARLPAASPTYQRARVLDTGLKYEWSGAAWVASASGGGSQQDSPSGNAAPTGTANVTIPGLSITITSAGTSAAHLVTIDADVRMDDANTVNEIELLVDGVAEAVRLITSGQALNARIAGSKTWRITGLSAGAHTFTARTHNAGAATDATVFAAHTFMTYQPG